MKRLMISAIAAIALLAAATSILRSHSPSAARPAGMMSLQELHTTTDVNKLPIEDVDDQSLVYSKTRQ
ncbi:MAG: hypothetical protein JWR80_9980 [Bradyrhizobium sp.]|nr:hypothetical protein [Bradyrhizobium sp.]